MTRPFVRPPPDDDGFAGTKAREEGFETAMVPN